VSPKFSDMTAEEFSSKFLHRVEDGGNCTTFTKSNVNHNFVPNPNNWDWAAQGAVTPVYNQGQCGSADAFPVVEVIESYFFLEGNPLTQFSVQQLVDCASNNEGCNGGLFGEAYAYIEDCGLEEGSNYPYNGENGQCQYTPADVGVGLSGCQELNGETQLYSQLSAPHTGGPISVCVDASEWQNYQGGILTSCTNNIDHCALLTGYGSYGSSGGYWIVRNSWGSDWGQNGYIWIAIGHDLCGIGDYASIPNVAPPPKNPPQSCYV